MSYYLLIISAERLQTKLLRKVNFHRRFNKQEIAGKENFLSKLISPKLFDGKMLLK